MFSRLAHHIHCSILHVQLYLLVETISIALVCLVNQYLQLIDTGFFSRKKMRYILVIPPLWHIPWCLEERESKTGHFSFDKTNVLLLLLGSLSCKCNHLGRSHKCHVFLTTIFLLVFLVHPVWLIASKCIWAFKAYQLLLCFYPSFQGSPLRRTFFKKNLKITKSQSRCKLWFHLSKALTSETK